jgi:WD40 repeat protein
VNKLRPAGSVSAYADRLRVAFAEARAARPVSLVVHDDAAAELAGRFPRIEILNDTQSRRGTIRVIRPDRPTVELDLPWGPRRAIINWAEISHDQEFLVAATKDYTARVFDLKTGREICAPLAHDREVQIARFSPDGRFVATGGWDTVAKLWELPSGKLVWERKDAGITLDLCFSPDGRLLAYANENGRIDIRIAETGERTTSPAPLARPVTDVEFRADSMELLAASDDGSVRRFTVADMKPEAPIIWLPQRVMKAAYSPDGSRVVTVSGDYGVHGFWHPGPTAIVEEQWLVPGRRRITATFELPTGPPRCKAFIRFPSERATTTVQGDRLIVSLVDGSIRLLTVKDLKELSSPGTIGPLPRGATYLWDGWWSYGDDAQSVLLKPTPAGPVVQHLPYPIADSLIRIDTDLVAGRVLGVGVIAFALSSGQERFRIAVPNLTKVRVDHRGRLYTLDANGQVTWYDARTGRPLGPPWKAHEYYAMHAIWSPDGRRILTNSYDKTVAVFDESGPIDPPPKPVLRLAHEANVSSAVWSPDGRRIATASDDCTARVWDSTTGRALIPPIRHAAMVNQVWFSRDGRLLVTRCGSQVSVWDSHSGQAVVYLPNSHAVDSDCVETAEGWLLGGNDWLASIDVADPPLPQLQQRAELLSARRLDASGTAGPIPVEDWVNLWRGLVNKEGPPGAR